MIKYQRVQDRTYRLWATHGEHEQAPEYHGSKAGRTYIHGMMLHVAPSRPAESGSRNEAP